jgi:hypothetical protein
MPPEQLERLVARLEQAAAELRAGELGQDRAAGLVEECARLAAEAGAALEDELRPPPTGQLPLT